jgi:serpin B
MRAAIHRTLGFSRGSRIAQAIDLRRTRDVWAELATNSELPGPLALANLFVFSPETKPLRNASLQLAAAGADVEVKDLSQPGVLTQINNWVRDRTRGAIPAILDNPPRNLSLVAIDALYFADRWRKPFDPAFTEVETFHAKRRDIKVRMMHLDTGSFQFRMDREFIAVELPYETPAYSMVILTTRNKPASPWEFASVAGWLSGKNFQWLEGDVAIPKFSLADQRNILPALDRMGLRRGRTAPGALGGLASSPLQISQILQRTIIEVDEKGTVAASATGVMFTRGMPHEFVRMIVDKPFLFTLLDKQAGLVIAAGYVASPKIQ